MNHPPLGNSTAAAIELRYPWMFSRGVDIAFFFFPVLLALAIFYLGQSSGVATSTFWTVVVFNAFGIGPIHQGATWFHYFDKKNREHYLSTTKHKRIFFLGPPLIVLIAIIGMFVAQQLTMYIWMFWNIQHLVQQNIGILLLYHNHNQGEAIVPRHLEVRSQHVAALLFFLLSFRYGFANTPAAAFYNGVILLVFCWAALCVGWYLGELAKQIRAGAYLNVPAFGFWLISLLILYPLAYFSNRFETAFLAPLVVHWFQYIGLNIMLVKNKYSNNERAENLPVNRPFLLFALTCLTLVAFIGVFAFGTKCEIFSYWQRNLLAGFLIGVSSVHFYLDAFIWRFREQYQREAVLPFLKQAKQKA
jgi:hypothetical protein